MVTLRNPAITAVRLTDKNNIAAAIRHHDHQGLGIGNARLRDGAAGRSDEDTVGDVIHPFNERRLAAGPSVGERPSRLLSDDDVAFIVTRATTLPGSLGCPLTRWRIRKLVAYLARCRQRRVVLSRERLRLILPEAGVSFQRTRTWKESRCPDKDAKLDRIGEVTSRFRHPRSATPRSCPHP